MSRTPVFELRTLWSESPWTLRVYVVGGGLLLLLNIVVHRTTYLEIMSVLYLVASYFLFRRVRWLWFVMVGGTAVYLLGYLLALKPIGAISNLVALVLLLLVPIWCPQVIGVFAQKRKTPRCMLGTRANQACN